MATLEKFYYWAIRDQFRIEKFMLDYKDWYSVEMVAILNEVEK